MNKIMKLPTKTQLFRSKMRNNVVDAIRYCQDQYKVSSDRHEQTLSELLGCICEFVTAIKSSDQKMQVFLNDSFWVEKPQVPKEKNCSILAVMYLIGENQSLGKDYKSALKYAKVVDELLENGIGPDGAADFIRDNGGVNAIASKVSSERSARRSEKKGRVPDTDQGDFRRNDPILDLDEDDPDCDQQNETLHRRQDDTNDRNVPYDAGDQGIKGKTVRPRFNPDAQLLVDADSKIQDVLAIEGQFTMVCYNTVQPDGTVTCELVSYTLVDETW